MPIGEVKNIDVIATKYLVMWNEQFALVNDSNIVSWAVRSAMQDIECWADGLDPNGANADALTQDEARQLYSILAPTASYFDYACRQELLPDTS